MHTRTHTELAPSGAPGGLSSVSPSPPAALLGMGIALPKVVNLRYVNSEVFVYEVRLWVFSTLRGRLGSGRQDYLLSSLPASTSSGVTGLAGPGSVRSSC